MFGRLLECLNVCRECIEHFLPRIFLLRELLKRLLQFAGILDGFRKIFSGTIYFRNFAVEIFNGGIKLADLLIDFV